MRTLLIIGAGGLGKEVVDIIRSSPQEMKWELAFVDDVVPAGTIVNGVRVIGKRTVLYERTAEDTDVCVAVGIPALRRTLIKEAEGLGFSVPTIIDSSALVRSSAQVENGVIIGARAFISCDTVIGAHVVINPGAMIGHDVTIGSYVVLGGGALLSGGARIGEGTLVGAGASVLYNTAVGQWATVGMGASIFTTVGDGITVLGNPARALPVMRERSVDPQTSTD